MNCDFEWDPVKAASNLKKHGVSFEEAAEIFSDPLHLSILDDADENEERWITLGNTKAYNSVWWCILLCCTVISKSPSVLFRQGVQRAMNRNSIRRHDEKRI